MITIRYSWACGRSPHVIGRELVRSVLGSSVRIGAPTPDDKPRVLGGGPDFSIAHAGELVVVAVARALRTIVGIDVERIDPRRPVAEIAEEALDEESAAELRAIESPAERAARFTTWWVRIEAAAKATGAGLTVPIDPTPPRLAIRDLAMPPGYRAALAWSTAP